MDPAPTYSDEFTMRGPTGVETTPCRVRIDPDGAEVGETFEGGVWRPLNPVEQGHVDQGHIAPPWLDAMPVGGV